ncbi:heavy metal translocating P-type ATPase [Streptomonospora sp. PA3]|uniref:heavy metal translocating P-type ATPase n=1 Tax=Streptomonospora sp. PA3 TaxID=2607326 RepID=UPI00210421BB|nr:heavy metal translocating P-type ATPase [Streptomonospora sp. PA3]
MAPTLVLFGLCLLGLAVGAAVWPFAPSIARAAWLAATATALVPAVWWLIQGIRARSGATDVIAALALLGSVAVQEYLAGAVIAVMLTGGRMLERHADGRARRDLGALLTRAPRTAHRRENGGLTTVDVAAVRPGDLLLVRAGEAVAVDGRVLAAAELREGPERPEGMEGRGSKDAGEAVALIDESAVTGEPLPVERSAGDSVASGTVNAGDPFTLRADADAEASTYAGIVRMAREAQAHSAPFVRMADRYALLLLPATLILAGAAWLVSADPTRAVAVLVVATPCPLILAAPIAFTGGLSRAARRGVIVKGGGALERLARARVLLFDKTGTVTVGRPRLSGVAVGPGGSPTEQDVLGLAASLEQASAHVLASAVVASAEEAGLRLEMPVGVSEVAGQGLRGHVGGCEVAVGRLSWVTGGRPPPSWIRDFRGETAAAGVTSVFVAVDGGVVGALMLDDPLRRDAPRTLRLLRRSGIDRAVMLTGDRAEVAGPIGEVVGADEVHAEQTPEGKVAVVRSESERAATVMVGDGVNDAPALAGAGVGVALGARGAAASSQAADVVITVDRLERLAEALTIARRSRGIARQSALVGMGMSLAAMLAAAVGWLPPAAGALLQEGIDVAVIVNALRSLGGPADGGLVPRLTGDSAELARRLDEEHRRLRPRVRRLPHLAGAVAEGEVPPVTVLDEIDAFARDLAEHERDDERLLYPEVARVLGGRDPTGTMSRAHADIAARLRRLGDLTARLRAGAANAPARRELERELVELHALLELHFTQEEEGYYSLAEDPDPQRSRRGLRRWSARG